MKFFKLIGILIGIFILLLYGQDLFNRVFEFLIFGVLPIVILYLILKACTKETPITPVDNTIIDKNIDINDDVEEDYDPPYK